jgi:enediyne biosynthesis protein E4
VRLRPTRRAGAVAENVRVSERLRGAVHSAALAAGAGAGVALVVAALVTTSHSRPSEDPVAAAAHETSVAPAASGARAASGGPGASVAPAASGGHAASGGPGASGAPAASAAPATPGSSTGPIVPAEALVPVASGTPSAPGPIRFRDVTEETGLAPHLAGWTRGHAAAWGDATGNGRPDLYVGAFADRDFPTAGAPIPNMLFLNSGDGFRLAPGSAARFEGEGGRASMALFADLDNRGELDLLVGMHAGSGPSGGLFRNRGAGSFEEVAELPWPARLHMRNVAALDLDQDGLLDLVVVDGRYGGSEQRLLALRNLGGHRFEEVGDRYGFPQRGIRGLGTAVGDVNGDGRLDIFVADANRLFLSQPDGTFEEYRPGFFHLDLPGGDDWACGAVLADLTGNGLLDLVVTVHAQAHGREPEVPGHIFLWVNRGIGADGLPRFENVTREAGLDLLLPRTGRTGVMLKAAGLALVDLDHDGRRDILLGMVRQNDQGHLEPVVLRNTGTVDGVPRFEVPPLESIVGYYAASPVADYDRDGRLDVFMATWFEELESHLFRNVTEAGNYLVVRVEGRGPGLNRMGVGATVRVYRAGRAGDPTHLLGRGDITLGNGYSVGEEALAHFGLGNESRVDLVVRWQGRTETLENAAVNRYMTVTVR